MSKQNSNSPVSHCDDLYRHLTLKHSYVIELLVVLVKNYDLVPNGSCSSDRDDLFPGSVMDAARLAALPEDIVWDLIQNEVVGKPLRQRDIEFLRQYRLVLDGGSWEIKPRRKGRSPAHRTDLNEPWKIWVYLRYLGNEIFYAEDGRMINPEDRIFVKPLSRDAAYLFAVPDPPSLCPEIRGIRGIASNDKRKSRDQGLSLAEVAMQRGIGQEMIQRYLGS